MPAAQDAPRKPAVDRLPGREIENDPGDNPCFGCGPDNVDGLRLRFFDDGDVVRSRVAFDERHASWRGIANMGLVFTAMMETGGWALWERVGPSRPETAFTFEQITPATLGPLTIEARVEVMGGKARIDAQALQDGRPVARGSWNARRAKPDEAKQLLARMSNVPRSLKPAFEDRAAKRD